MAKEVQISCHGEIKQTAEDLDQFLNKVTVLFNFDFPLIDYLVCLRSFFFLVSHRDFDLPAMDI